MALGDKAWKWDVQLRKVPASVEGLNQTSACSGCEINNASLISALLLRCTHKKKVRAERGENYPKAKLNESPTNIMRKESTRE